MTCIAAIIDRNRTIYMGCDSALSTESSLETVPAWKVFLRGPTIIGCSGDIWLINVIRHKFRAPALNGWKPEAYVGGPFVDKLKQVCRDAGHRTLGDGADMLVGTKGMLFQVFDAFEVMPVKRRYAAIGGGAPYALGALWVLGAGDNCDAKTQLRDALKCASVHHPAVRGRFSITKIEYEG